MGSLYEVLRRWLADEASGQLPTEEQILTGWRVVLPVGWSTAVCVALLSLTACSDSSLTGLGISRGAIQSELDHFDFEPPLPRSDGQPAVIGRKYPEIAAMTGEVVELILVGAEHELTEATVWFSTEIDGLDARDVGAFMGMVAPSANGMDWIIDGFHAGWVWNGFEEINGDAGDVHIEALRLPGFIAITFTPR